LEKGDVIKALGPYAWSDDKPPERMTKSTIYGKKPIWLPMTSTKGAVVVGQLSLLEVKKVAFQIERGKETFEVVVDLPVDLEWPRVDRGFRFDNDKRIERTDNIVEALAFGWKDTYRFIGRLYVQLRSLVTNRISFVENVSGPIGIFAAAADHFDAGFFYFLRLLGVISINLAVVNFLPIPVLDGGHMVFLIYEGIRRKPAPEGVRIATTYIGLALILGLMLFVVYLDVSKLLF